MNRAKDLIIQGIQLKTVTKKAKPTQPQTTNLQSLQVDLCWQETDAFFMTDWLLFISNTYYPSLSCLLLFHIYSVASSSSSVPMEEMTATALKNYEVKCQAVEVDKISNWAGRGTGRARRNQNGWEPSKAQSSACTGSSLGWARRVWETGKEGGQWLRELGVLFSLFSDSTGESAKTLIRKASNGRGGGGGQTHTKPRRRSTHGQNYRGIEVTLLDAVEPAKGLKKSCDMVRAGKSSHWKDLSDARGAGQWEQTLVRRGLQPWHKSEEAARHS